MEEDDEDDPSKVVVRYRMAYVGTVALTDKTSEVLASWRKELGPLRQWREAFDMSPALEEAVTARRRNDRANCSILRVAISVVALGAKAIA